MRWSLFNIQDLSHRDNGKTPNPEKGVGGTFLFLVSCDVLCAALWLYLGLREGDSFNYVIAALWLIAGLFNGFQYRRQKKKYQREEENNG